MLHFLTRRLPLCLPRVDVTQGRGGHFSNSSAGVFDGVARDGQCLQWSPQSPGTHQKPFAISGFDPVTPRAAIASVR